MLNIAICDDEKKVAEELKADLLSLQMPISSEMEISLFSSAQNLEYEILEGKEFDILFLDIEIGAVNGIALAEKIQKQIPEAEIIFITGHYQYVYDTFRVRPCGFLRKPFDLGEIRQTFCRAVEFCNDARTFSYHVKQGTYRIDLQDIYYFMSVNRKILMITKRGEISYYGKLDDAEKQLKELTSGFIRISKSFLVNAKYITGIRNDSVDITLPARSERLGISQAYRGRVKQQYMNLWKSREEIQ